MNATRRTIELAAGDALIVVDVQNDFLPGGSFAVPYADTALPVFNCYVSMFAGCHLPIFLTRDWHPANHCSFLTQGGRWPAHCIADSDGAALAPALILPPWTVVISKGLDAGKEADSAFDQTDLERRLRGSSLRRLFVGGLATVHGVLGTVHGALARGFAVFLLSDAIRDVSADPDGADGADDARDAESEMVVRGAVPLRVEGLFA